MDEADGIFSFVFLNPCENQRADSFSLSFLLFFVLFSKVAEKADAQKNITQKT